MEVADIRRCPKCETKKTLADFTLRKSGPRNGQPVAYCKACCAEQQKRINSEDDTLYRRVQWPSKIRNKYGIEPSDYYRMLDEQGGGCALCAALIPSNRHYSRRGKPEMFYIDHCHTTGAVRGLLCHACNRALGLIRDNPLVAERMAAYLRKGN